MGNEATRTDVDGTCVEGIKIVVEADVFEGPDVVGTDNADGTEADASVGIGSLVVEGDAVV